MYIYFTYVCFFTNARWAQATNSIMNRRILFTFYLVTTALTATLGQKVNLIIQVNDKLIVTGLYNFHIAFDSVESRKQFTVNYVPGDLSIDENVWSKINLDSISRLFLKFDYSTFNGGNQEIANFSVELTQQKLKQRYLILNIYDFRDKKYKNWYQWHTDKKFLAELNFPGSGIYIRKR